MPIVVEHQPSFGVVGAAAYAAGQGAREERDIRERNKYGAIYSRMALQAQLQRESQAAQMRQFYDQLSSRAWELDVQREHQTQRDMFLTETGREERAYDWDQRRAMYAEQNQAYAERARQQQITQGLQDGTLRYTPSQKKQLAHLQTALSDLQTDPRFNDSERMQFARLLQERIHAISPMPVPVDERPQSPAERWGAATVLIDPRTMQPLPEGSQSPGLPFTYDEDGQPTGIRQFPYQAIMDRFWGDAEAEQRVKAMDAFDDKWARWKTVESEKRRWISEQQDAAGYPEDGNLKAQNDTRIQGEADRLFPNIPMPTYPTGPRLGPTREAMGVPAPYPPPGYMQGGQGPPPSGQPSPQAPPGPGGPGGPGGMPTQPPQRDPLAQAVGNAQTPEALFQAKVQYVLSQFSVPEEQRTLQWARAFIMFLRENEDLRFDPDIERLVTEAKELLSHGK